MIILFDILVIVKLLFCVCIMLMNEYDFLFCISYFFYSILIFFQLKKGRQLVLVLQLREGPPQNVHLQVDNQACN